MLETEEEWRHVRDFPHYVVSDLGRIKHVDRRTPRRLRTNERGFVVVLLSSNSSPTRYLRQVNKLVARAFLPVPEYDSENSIWHLDGDLTNCRADNLRWDLRSRVLEWNEMHRTGEPKFPTPRVKNNTTGRVYTNAYECGLAEGLLESTVLWFVERQADHMEDNNAEFRYLFNASDHA